MHPDAGEIYQLSSESQLTAQHWRMVNCLKLRLPRHMPIYVQALLRAAGTPGEPRTAPKVGDKARKPFDPFLYGAAKRMHREKQPSLLSSETQISTVSCCCQLGHW